jgi:hypothetical protein
LAARYFLLNYQCGGCISVLLGQARLLLQIRRGLAASSFPSASARRSNVLSADRAS